MNDPEVSGDDTLENLWKIAQSNDERTRRVLKWIDDQNENCN